MANLFLVHTPFQLFVAQQIINQEGLRNNILLSNYIPGNEHFNKIYDAMIIPEMWMDIKHAPQYLAWSSVDLRDVVSIKRFHQSIERIRNSFSEIDGFIRDHRIDTLFMGDMSNRCLQMLANIYSRRNLRIVFFEEGTSHYILRYIRPANSFIKKVYHKYLEHLLNRKLFLPLFGFKYATEYYFKSVDFDNIPMNERYSIVPLYKKSFDKVLYPKVVNSEKVSAMIESEINYLPSNSYKKYLYISSPIYECTSENDFYIVEEVFSKIVTSFEPDVYLFIKFHPREIPKHIQSIISIVERHHVNYRVLSNNINIPVEYYLQNIEFSKIYSFGSSAIFYNGYIYPKTEIVRMELMYLQLCLDKHLSNTGRIEDYCEAYTKEINLSQKLMYK